MRKLTAVAAAILAFTATAGVTVASDGTAIAAPAHVVVTPHKPGPGGEQADGTIRPAINPHWCLTWPLHVQKNDPVLIEPCLKGAPDQFWTARRIYAFGRIFIPHTNLSVGQRGILRTARLVDDSGDDPSANFILNFSSVSHGMLIGVNFHGQKWLTAPARLRRGIKVYRISWQPGPGTAAIQQQWLFPAWYQVKH